MFWPFVTTCQHPVWCQWRPCVQYTELTFHRIVCIDTNCTWWVGHNSQKYQALQCIGIISTCPVSTVSRGLTRGVTCPLFPQLAPVSCLTPGRSDQAPPGGATCLLYTWRRTELCKHLSGKYSARPGVNWATIMRLEGWRVACFMLSIIVNCHFPWLSETPFNAEVWKCNKQMLPQNQEQLSKMMLV